MLNPLAGKKPNEAVSPILVADLVLMFVIMLMSVLAFYNNGFQIWGAQLAKTAQVQEVFWSEIAGDLCREPNAELPPPRPAEALPSQVAWIQDLAEYRNSIWPVYEDCQEPRTVVIDESLLNFSFDKFDSFESVPDPDVGMQKIFKIVDESIRTHSMIYVTGHTDRLGDTSHNYELSRDRAAYIGMRIRQYLTVNDKVEGRDFALYTSGMGAAQLLDRRLDPDEKSKDWDQRCRRIELSFKAQRAQQ